jgi:unsaturated rhamnogalacturonyl hydrolase
MVKKNALFLTFDVSGAAVKIYAAAVCCAAVLFPAIASGQQASWSQRIAQSAIQRWPGGNLASAGSTPQWNHELGVLLEGMDTTWYNTADGQYYKYVKESIDKLVTPDGAISSYNSQAYALDDLLLGRQLLLLYRATQDKRYYKAAFLLRQQLLTQPKTASGGFWHNQSTSGQMWLDGLYMAEPFFAEYAAVFQEPQDFAEITRQFVLMEEHARDAKTGLLYQGWDETKQQPWADRKSGHSPSFWARGMGWYMMALVDTLPYYPADDPGRAALLAILNRTATAVIRYQDHETGLWYQVLDKGGAEGNYFESSAACMFTYALAKGVRLGYLPQRSSAHAEEGWKGIRNRFVKTDSDGALTLTGTVKSIGLSGGLQPDKSYAYYVSSPVVSNDPKGVGAFLLAAGEMELEPDATLGLGKKALLDGWYNSQKRKNAAGETEYFHYKWSDYSNSGFSLFGSILRGYGMATDTLYAAPTLDALKDAHFYVIVSPDNPAKNPDPHYMTEGDATQIAAWVKAGGVLLIFENDPDNADIPHVDLLADKFGLHFNNALTHHVIGNDIKMGRIELDTVIEPFTITHVLYMKDTCSLALTRDAAPLLTYKGDVLMAKAKYGKGTVLAVADPWLYNEYTDGRILQAEYDNFAAGRELVRWLLQQR